MNAFIQPLLLTLTLSFNCLADIEKSEMHMVLQLARIKVIANSLYAITVDKYTVITKKLAFN